ncbi:MAG: hypothetical protein WA705_30990 [Candidatus Ozemobacteraceae bacterium]
MLALRNVKKSLAVGLLVALELCSPAFGKHVDPFQEMEKMPPPLVEYPNETASESKYPLHEHGLQPHPVNPPSLEPVSAPEPLKPPPPLPFSLKLRERKHSSKIESASSSTTLDRDGRESSEKSSSPHSGTTSATVSGTASGTISGTVGTANTNSPGKDVASGKATRPKPEEFLPPRNSEKSMALLKSLTGTKPDKQAFSQKSSASTPEGQGKPGGTASGTQIHEATSQPSGKTAAVSNPAAKRVGPLLSSEVPISTKPTPPSIPTAVSKPAKAPLPLKVTTASTSEFASGKSVSVGKLTGDLASATPLGEGISSVASGTPETAVASEVADAGLAPEGNEGDAKPLEAAMEGVFKKGRSLREEKKWDELEIFLRDQERLPAIPEILEWRIETQYRLAKVNYVALKRTADELLGKSPGNDVANFALAFYYANNPKKINKDEALKYLSMLLKKKKPYDGAKNLYWTVLAKKYWLFGLILLGGLVAGAQEIKKRRLKAAGIGVVGSASAEDDSTRHVSSPVPTPSPDGVLPGVPEPKWRVLLVSLGTKIPKLAPFVNKVLKLSSAASEKPLTESPAVSLEEEVAPDSEVPKI